MPGLRSKPTSLPNGCLPTWRRSHMAKRSLGTESTPTFIDNPKTWAFIGSGFEELFINVYPPADENSRTFFPQKKGEAIFLKRKVVVSLPVPLFFKRHSWFFWGSIGLQDVIYCKMEQFQIFRISQGPCWCVLGDSNRQKQTWRFYFVHLSSTHHKGSQLLHFLLMYDAPLKGRLV